MAHALLSPLRRLRTAPLTMPLLVVTALFVVGARNDGGYPLRYWYPGALIVLAILTVCAIALRSEMRMPPRPVLIACALLLAFTAWSFLSIAWADSQGDAWDGANRTLLYLLVFVLFALWPQRGDTAAAVLGLWTAGVIVLAGGVLLAVGTAADPLRYFIGERLATPVGYPNGAGALFLMPLWPALMLAGRRELWWWLRGLFAGGAVLLADMALLSQSRGAVFSVPIVVILYFLIVPQRPRSFAVLIPVAAAVAATAPEVLDVATRLTHDVLAPHAVEQPILLASGIVALAVAAGALLESRARLPERVRRTTYRAVGAAGLATALALVAVGLVSTGDPVARASHEWSSFTHGYRAIKPGESRLTQGLGSNRYDFYRVAFDSFRRHPIAGVGSENFLQDYLLRGRSDETPRFPHSVELRTLSQTGIVGAALLLGWLAAALLGVLQAVRRVGGLAGGVAGAATVTFLYWLVHGSFDWFWEIAGLGAPAFAMLGLACALAPRAATPAGATAGGARSHRRPVTVVAVVTAAVLGLAALCSLAAPWLADLQIRKASTTWPANPRAAFDRLDSAANLNQLGDRPSLTSGTIALRIGDLERADRAFAEASRRNPRDDYPYFERGAIASVRGQHTQAISFLEHAAALNPRDRIVREALTMARSGQQIDIEALNSAVVTRTRKLNR